MPENYFIGVDARELDRLQDQHAAWLPETQALWKAAGFRTGEHIADLGSGPGFAALDLARIVGTSGRVTALDKASPFLAYLRDSARREGLDNIETVEADMASIDAIGGPFDGAFCRFFLAFLIADLDRVLSTIHASLRQGGFLAAMEYLTLGSTTSSPPMRGFDGHTRAWSEYYRKHGGDTAVGTYLPARLVAAGFEIVSIACAGGVAAPSHRWWRWWERLIADFGEKLVSEGCMQRDELEALRSDWASASRDPNAFIHTPLLLQVVARKPVRHEIGSSQRSSQ